MLIQNKICYQFQIPVPIKCGAELGTRLINTIEIDRPRLLHQKLGTIDMFGQIIDEISETEFEKLAKMGMNQKDDPMQELFKMLKDSIDKIKIRRAVVDKEITANIIKIFFHQFLDHSMHRTLVNGFWSDYMTDNCKHEKENNQDINKYPSYVSDSKLWLTHENIDDISDLDLAAMCNLIKKNFYMSTLHLI